MTMHRFLYFILLLNVKSNIIIFLKRTVDMGGQKRLLMVEWLASLINSFKKCYVTSDVSHYYSANYLFSTGCLVILPLRMMFIGSMNHFKISTYMNIKKQDLVIKEGVKLKSYLPYKKFPSF